MPDNNGIMTPQEIADLGVNALLKVKQLREGDIANDQRAKIFEQQLQTGELDLKIKRDEFELTQLKKALLGLKEIDPATGQPKVQPTPSQWAMAEKLGWIPAATPFSSLDPADRGRVGRVAGGIETGEPSADAGVQADVAMRGQDITQNIEGNRLQQARELADSESFAKYLDAGANPNILSQAPMSDLRNVAKAFEGVDPTQRINAIANYVSAKASLARAEAESFSLRESTRLASAQEKNRFRPLEILTKNLSAQTQALSAAQNANNPDAIASGAINVARASDILAQEYKRLGYTFSPEAEPEPGWFKKTFHYLTGDFFKGNKDFAGGGGFDINKVVDAQGNINLDAEIGGSQPSGASPDAATPTPQNPPAAGAPTSSLPLLDNTGRTVNYMSPEAVMAQLQARLAQRQAAGTNQGITEVPQLPGASAGPASLPLTPPAAKAPAATAALPLGANATPQEIHSVAMSGGGRPSRVEIAAVLSLFVKSPQVATPNARALLLRLGQPASFAYRATTDELVRSLSNFYSNTK